MPRRRSRRPEPATARAHASSRRNAPTGSPSSTRCASGAIDPYPVRYDRDHTAAEIQERFADLGPGADSGEGVSVAGRVIALRRHGGLDFIDLRDETAKIQLIATRDELGEDALHDLNALDLGDWIGTEGIVVTSRRGELSIRVESFKLLSKALRPLPDMRHGLTDPEARYRRRYLDLIVDDDSREIFAKRSTVIAATREVLLERGFREVETPVLLSQAAAPRRGRSSPTTTRSTSTCTCGSPSSCR